MRPDTKEVFKSVEVFDIEKSEWRSGPELNQERFGNSSCVLGHRIYTFGGFKDAEMGKSNALKRMERMDASELVAGGSPQWETLDFLQEQD